MGRYFADVSLAGVHSARLAEGHRNALSHSFTLGWNMAKEKFMKGSRVDDLLLSASYSNLSEDIDVYRERDDEYFYLYRALWATEGSGFNWNDGTTVDRTYSKSGSNPGLDFIHRNEFSVTLRGSFFKKLLTTDLTFFNTDMSGFIVQNPTDFPSHLQSGLGSSTFNPLINNNVQNRKGLDFSVKVQKQFKKVYVALGVVGTYLKTNHSKFDEIVEYDYQHVQDHPLDAIWGYKCLGFYTADDFDVSTTADGKTKYTLKEGLPESKVGGSIQPGDLKYQDMNGDGIINNKDLIYLGRSGAYGAPVTKGVNFTLKYKNFTLFVVGNGEFGAYGVMNSFYYKNPKASDSDRVYSSFGNYYYMSGEAKYSVNALGRWTPETADVATHPRLTTLNSNNNAAPSTFWLYTTDRFNLRKVQLTYDFSEDLFKRKIVKALSIYVNANDLFTLSNNRKLLETNIGYAPQTRFYNLGVKATF